MLDEDHGLCAAATTTTAAKMMIYVKDRDGIIILIY